MKKIDVRVREAKQKNMDAIKNKDTPSIVEKYKYIKYILQSLPEDKHQKALDEIASKWGKEEVTKILRDIEAESPKIPPKKYYVSLRDPLDDPMTR